MHSHSKFDYWLYENLLYTKEKLPRIEQIQLELWAFEYDKANYSLDSPQHAFFCNIFDWPIQAKAFELFRPCQLQQVIHLLESVRQYEPHEELTKVFSAMEQLNDS